MKTRWLLVEFLLACLALLADLPRRELIGTVTRVIDADTIIIRHPHDGSETRIRFAWVDGLERDQPHGDEATEWTRDMLEGERVIVRRTGRSYNRIVGEVIAEGKTESVNVGLLRAGWGLVDRRYSSQLELQAAQQEAMDSSRGVWGDVPFVPPWAWREWRR